MSLVISAANISTCNRGCYFVKQTEIVWSYGGDINWFVHHWDCCHQYNKATFLRHAKKHV